MLNVLSGNKSCSVFKKAGSKFFNSIIKRTKLIDQNWKSYLYTHSPNSNKKAFMDISMNKKSLKLSELEGMLKNKGLLDPFRSKKNIDFNLNELTEGRAKIIIPENEEQYDPDAKYDLFSIYNIVMMLERDISLLVMKEFIEEIKKKSISDFEGVNIFESFSGSGVKTLRILKELDLTKIKTIVSNDEHSRYIDYMNLLLDVNNLNTETVNRILKLRCNSNKQALLASQYNFNEKTNLEGFKYHIINLDPFSYTTNYFEHAFNSLHNGGMISATFSDGANHSGEKRSKSTHFYESYRDKMGPNAHEHALRMIFYSIENTAAKQHKYIKPLFSFYSDFYAKVYFQVFDSKSEAEKTMARFSKVFKCNGCPNIITHPLGEIKKNDKNQEICVPSLLTSKVSKCEICEGTMTLSGPIWNKNLHDWEFVKKLINSFFEVKKNQKIASIKNQLLLQTKFKIEAIFYGIVKEMTLSHIIYSFYPNEYGFFFKLIKKPNLDKIEIALNSLGYQLRRSAIFPFALKTNAPNRIVMQVFLAWHKMLGRDADANVIRPFKTQEDEEEEMAEQQNSIEFKAYPAKNVGLSKVLSRGLIEKVNFNSNKVNSEKLSMKKSELEKEIDLIESLFEVKKYSFFFKNPDKHWGPTSLKVKANYKRPESLKLPRSMQEKA